MKKLSALLLIAIMLCFGIFFSCFVNAEDATDASRYYNDATQKISNNDFKGALQDLNKAIAIISNDYELYNTRGFVKSMLKDYKGAINDCSKVLELKPDYADGYFNRALSKADLKDFNAAIADMQKAKALYMKQKNKSGYDDSEKKISKFKSLMK